MLNPFNYSKSLKQSLYGWTGSPFTSCRLLRLKGKDQTTLLVLCYHRIVSTHSDGDYCDNFYFLNLPQKIFISQINWLVHYYRVVGLDEILKGRRLPPRAALITFDDGFMDTYETAFPFLKLQGLPATVFLIGSVIRERKAPWISRLHWILDRSFEKRLHIGEVSDGNGLKQKHGRHNLLIRLKAFLKIKDIKEISLFLDRLEEEQSIASPLELVMKKFMGEKQIKELCDHGWTVGNHTDNHLNLASLTPERVREEIEDAHEALSIFAGYRKVLAVPFGLQGSYTAQTVDISRRSGIDHMFTALGGLNEFPGTGTVIDRVICETFSRAYFRLLASGGKKSLEKAFPGIRNLSGI